MATYLFAVWDGGGSAPPELALARQLVERGHDVVVLADPVLEDDVRATGGRFRPWEQGTARTSRRPEDDPIKDWECKTPISLFRRVADKQLFGPAPGYVADTEAAIAAESPDAIVSCFMLLAVPIAAEAADLPFALMMPNCYSVPAPGMPPFGSGFRPARGPLGRIRDRVMNAVSTRALGTGLPKLNALRAERGLAELGSVWDQPKHADEVLVLTSGAFDFPAELDANVHYVGPRLADPAWVEPWTPPPGDEPLVLVALSSTFQDQVGTLQQIVDGLGRLPVRGVVTTGPAVSPDQLRAPANVQVVEAAPHAEVLQHASAVVTHAGHGTVVKALAAGVPLLCLPMGRDQADNAVRVVVRGAGLKLKRSAKASRIAAAVSRLIDEPSFRSSAADLGAKLRADAASPAAVELLESIVPATTEVSA
jgi:MGT family glycosyltransferase